ncbi:MAG TPA: tRNA 2-thiouridine(34) synthase MnmA [Candidatus Polarisedimenticolia bacterium]|nr:tRNA 2-thiouridine(34) synthase MnmA [Candidatus Polarisedimenticolia bacterium]
MSGVRKEEEAASGRIAVAMSGGVDSSVAALLLHEKGESLVGISLQLFDAGAMGLSRFGRCCSPSDFVDARKVAHRLGISYYVLNMEREFRQAVIENFIDEYDQGRTPLPCARCNTEVKFGELLHRARTLGCETVATGHYARRAWDPATSRTKLFRSVDREKDQSYFLFGLTPDQLDRALFPVGEMKKESVRELARRAGFCVADKQESMDLCFLPAGGYRSFLERERGTGSSEGGEIIDAQGTVLGRHDGVRHFTVGQRRGLGLATGKPMYVLAIEPGPARVIVGEREEQERTHCVVRAPNWVSARPPSGSIEAMVQIRHRHPGGEAVVQPDPGGGVAIRFRIPQRAITPGQAAVFYRDDEVLGGGTIASVH